MGVCMKFLAAAVLTSLIIVPLVGLAPPAAATHTTPDLTEDFEDDTALDLPTADWYTHTPNGTGTDQVASATPSGFSIQPLGGKSWWTSGAAYGSWLDLGGDACQREGSFKINFAYAYAVNPPKTTFIGLQEYPKAEQAAVNPGASMGFGLSTTGTWSVIVREDNGNSNSDSLTALPADTWGNFSLEVKQCNDGTGESASVRGCYIEAQSCKTVTVATPIGNGDSLRYFGIANQGAASGGSRANSLLDNIQVFHPPPVDLSSEASIAATNLVGFDVDKDGVTVITREDAGDDVKTYAAGPLSNLATATTDCNTGRAVSSLGSHVLFKECNPGGSFLDFRIASPQLTTPVFPAGCGDECSETFTDAALQNAVEISDVETYPFDYSGRVERSGAIIDRSFVPILIAFAQADGVVGVFADLNVNNEVNDDDVATVVFDPSSSPQVDQICLTFDDVVQEDYLYAATQNGATMGWQINTVISNAQSQTRDATIDVSLQNILVNNGALANGNALGCGASTVAVSSTNQLINVLQRQSGAYVQILRLEDEPQVANRGLAVDQTGQYMATAYTDGTGKVWDIALGEDVATFAWDSTETMRGVHLDASAQNLWVATNATITRFSTYAVTTGDPVFGSGFGDLGEGEVVADAGGVISDDARANFASSFGITSGSASLFIGFLFMVGMAMAGLAVVPEHRVLGAAIGAGLGIALGFTLGFFTASFVFIVVVLIMGAAFFTIRARSGAA